MTLMTLPDVKRLGARTFVSRMLVAGSALALMLGGCSLDRDSLKTGLSTNNVGPGGTIPGAGNSGGGGGNTGGTGVNTGGGTTGGTSSTAGNGGAGTGNINPDAGPPVPPGHITDTGDVVCGTALTKGGTCRATASGIYALKTEVDVWWKDEVNAANQPLVDPGRGKITIVFMATITDVCDDGSAALTSLKTCGSTLPPFFVDAVCNVIQIEFPDEMWDQPGMPVYKTRGSVTGFEPGDFLEIDKVTGMLGIELDSVDATWPKATQTATFACPSGTGEGCFPDQDGDGHPGVTVHMNPGGTVTNAPYACGSGQPWKKTAAPLSIGDAAFNSQGASTAYIGLRMALGGRGALASDCLHGVGAGVSSPDIPSRLIDCVLEDGKSCTAANANFVDSNVPNYHLLQAGETPPAPPVWQHVRENNTSPFIPKVTLDRSVSLGPRMSVVRVADVGVPVACAAIRGAPFSDFQ